MSCMEVTYNKFPPREPRWAENWYAGYVMAAGITAVVAFGGYKMVMTWPRMSQMMRGPFYNTTYQKCKPGERY